LFRITQSFLVNAFAAQIKRENWNVLFTDFVNARRSGASSQGAMNYCFESIFDRFPDVVAVKDAVMLVAEVDLSYKELYVKKLRTFQSRKEDIFQCARSMLDLDIKFLALGLAFLRKPPISVARADDFSIWLYDPKREEFRVYKQACLGFP